MVKIGKLNPLSFERGGRIPSGQSFAPIPKEGDNTLKDLPARLDAIGTRELRPRYDEKNLDYYV